MADTEPVGSNFALAHAANAYRRGCHRQDKDGLAEIPGSLSDQHFFENFVPRIPEKYCVRHKSVRRWIYALRED
jgi:hypothetical protein